MAERKVICRYLRPDGERCQQEALNPDADAVLCLRHTAGSVGALDAARLAMFGPETTIGIERSEREQAAYEQLAACAGLVYYFSCWGHVKIGTTTNISSRMMDLKAVEVLATEPGSYRVENQRHQQFRHLRVVGEYFRPAPDLTAHMEAIRAQHGPPITDTATQLSVGRRRSNVRSGQHIDPARLGAERLIAAIRHR